MAWIKSNDGDNGLALVVVDQSSLAASGVVTAGAAHFYVIRKAFPHKVCRSYQSWPFVTFRRGSVTTEVPEAGGAASVPGGRQ